MSDIHQLELLVSGEYGDPHRILGPHTEGGSVVLRVFKPLAESVVAVHGDERTILSHVHAGVWEGDLGVTEVPDYRVEVTYARRRADGVRRPVPVPPHRRRDDLHLINEGRHENLWEVLGAHVRHYEGLGGSGVTGTSFSVWAPHARGVRLKGDFNSWDGREHPMRQFGTSGVWELFLPGVGSGAQYKFVILGADGQWREKADPMAFHTEVPPATSSVVFESRHTVVRRRLDGRAPRGRHRSTSRCRSTRCTSVVAHAASRTPRWATSSRRTARTSASPTSSSCPSWSTRSAARGATR